MVILVDSDIGVTSIYLFVLLLLECNVITFILYILHFFYY